MYRNRSAPRLHRFRAVHPAVRGRSRALFPPVGGRLEDHLPEPGSLHMAGDQVGWSEFHSLFEFKCSLPLLDLPRYAWSDKNHWIQYNGDWALSKGNTFYNAEKTAAAEASGSVSNPLVAPRSSLRTSVVHRVVEETFSGSAGRVVFQSDMMQAGFLDAAWGHQMNGAGVVASVSIYRAQDTS